MSEKDFIRELKNFFVDIEFNESAEKRINYLLEKYKEKNCHVKEVDRIIRHTEVVYRDKYVYLQDEKFQRKVKAFERDLETAPKLEDILKQVCDQTGVSIEDIKGPKRYRHLVDARRLFVVMALKTYNYSLKSVGNAIGRDHSGAIHLRDSFIDLYGRDADPAKKVV
jgi:chromosomal replication initiation ATPase DnaA